MEDQRMCAIIKEDDKYRIGSSVIYEIKGVHEYIRKDLSTVSQDGTN